MLDSMTRLAAVLTCLVLAGCSAAPSKESQERVDLGANVRLAPGASVSVKAAAMSVRFIAVTEDSRCPRDVTCVWAGEVKVQLALNDLPMEILGGSNAVAAGYRVTLVQVEPEPLSTARIAPQDYRATLKIDKVD
jgi:hypothetical protein